MISYLLVAACFVVLALLIPWRNKRVGAYRVHKLNSRQSIPAVHLPASAMKVSASKVTTKTHLKAVQ